MVTVHLSLPEPPGERGKKVQYFFAKPRYKVVAPMCVFTAAMLGGSGWFMWSGQNYGTALYLFAMSLVLVLLSVVVWLRGSRMTARLNYEMQNASVDRSSRKFPRLGDGAGR